jgi:uncharacterized protein (TIGR02646 family)
LSFTHSTRKQKKKIEHWHSQKNYPGEQLDYLNLLGACMGNEGSPGKEQHCDSRKGEKDISRNPANQNHQIENFVRYEGDGQITSQDPVFDSELNNILNLNMSFLKNARKAILDGFKSTLDKRGPLQRSTIEKWVQEWNGESHTGELYPYCQVIVYWLRKRLARF